MLAGALLAVAGSAVCYGAAVVLQASALRRTPAAAGLDPRVLTRALRQLPFLGGLALDLVGFALSLVALRTLPLFAVEAVVAANIAVAAVLAVIFLGAHLSRRERWSVAAVALGLGLLGASAAADGAVPVGSGLRWACALATVALVLAGIPVARTTGPRSAATLGLLAGLAFGALGVSTRILRDPTSLRALLHDPATLGLVVGGVGGFLLYAVALQRGSVVTATAPLVVAETVAPAIVGILLLGDRARPGWVVPAAVGFALAVAGTVVLARYAEPAETVPAAAA